MAKVKPNSCSENCMSPTAQPVNLPPGTQTMQGQTIASLSSQCIFKHFQIDHFQTHY